MPQVSLPQIHVAAEVAEAQTQGGAVVALETSIIAQGLPWPVNFEVAQAMGAAVRAAGAVPALTAVVGGAMRLGLDEATVERLARDGAIKASARDLGRLAASGETGATTVAGTLRMARAAGVAVMATGGIGGVHREAQGFDVSADLDELAASAVMVVASGAKSILDLPRTLEWLEMRSVPVLGWCCDRLPAFYVADSGLPVPRLDTHDAVVATARRHWALGGGGLVVAQPPPAPLPTDAVERWVEAALAGAAREGVSGASTTPFLLNELARLSDGATLEANRGLAVANARLAGELAVRLAT